MESFEVSRELGCDDLVHIAAYPYEKTLCGQSIADTAQDHPVQAADCVMCCALETEFEIRADEVMALA